MAYSERKVAIVWDNPYQEDGGPHSEAQEQQRVPSDLSAVLRGATWKDEPSHATRRPSGMTVNLAWRRTETFARGGGRRPVEFNLALLATTHPDVFYLVVDDTTWVGTIRRLREGEWTALGGLVMRRLRHRQQGTAEVSWPTQHQAVRALALAWFDRLEAALAELRQVYERRATE